MLPTLLSLPAFHSFAAGKLTENIAGDLTLQRLRLRWLSPGSLAGVRFAAPDGRPVLEVEQCLGDRSLLQLMMERSTIGTLRLIDPTVHLLLDENGNNIAAAVHPKTEQEFLRERLEDLKALKNKPHARVTIERGRFVFQASPGREPVTLEPFDIGLTIEPVPETDSAIIHLEPAVVFHRLELSRALCDDLLKFAAPALADASWVRGMISMEIYSGSFPVDNLAAGELTGKLTIHEITAGPGPIVAEIAAALGVMPEIRLVDESEIEFEMRDRQVMHRGMLFQLGGFDLETSGTVHLDESVNLIAQIVFPEAADGAGELARRLAGKKMRLPIAGTLSRPRLDWSAIMQDHPLLDEFVENVMDPDETPILDVLRDVRQRRQQGQNGQQSSRPLGRLLRSLLSRDTEQAADVQAAQPSADNNHN
jgi:hypothetical protein